MAPFEDLKKLPMLRWKKRGPRIILGLAGEVDKSMEHDFKTDRDFLDRLEAAAKQHLNRDQLFHQRVSFVYGNMPSDSSVTRMQVERELARSEGVVA
jgi:hypothetical protein